MLHDQLVPNPCHSFNFDRATLHFFTQVCDVYVYRAGLAVKVKAPGLLEQLFACKDAPRLLRQGVQQVEFLGTQVEGPVCESGFAASRIDGQVAYGDGPIISRCFFSRRRMAFTRATNSRGLNGLVR
jgi:hypothetical protein